MVWRRCIENNSKNATLNFSRVRSIVHFMTSAFYTTIYYARRTRKVLSYPSPIISFLHQFLNCYFYCWHSFAHTHTGANVYQFHSKVPHVTIMSFFCNGDNGDPALPTTQDKYACAMHICMYWWKSCFLHFISDGIRQWRIQACDCVRQIQYRSAV